LKELSAFNVKVRRAFVGPLLFGACCLPANASTAKRDLRQNSYVCSYIYDFFGQQQLALQWQQQNNIMNHVRTFFFSLFSSNVVSSSHSRSLPSAAAAKDAINSKNNSNRLKSDYNGLTTCGWLAGMIMVRWKTIFARMLEIMELHSNLLLMLLQLLLISSPVNCNPKNLSRIFFFTSNFCFANQLFVLCFN